MADKRILGPTMELISFCGVAKSTDGYVHLAFGVGLIVALTQFHVINLEVSYRILLGQPWIHKHCLVPLTYHQFMKGRLIGKPIKIAGNPSPFNRNEVNFVETMFYDELAPIEECFV
nr:hypothetical protein CFP56_14167 [Quercus suber]